MEKASASQPLVSVIIPTLNSERFLQKCLESLERQTCRSEVIVVDDGSTDSTLEIAERHNCRVVKNPKKGRAEAKNEGAKHSRGKYLIFIDSDMELTRNVIVECVKFVEDNSYVGGIVIPERSIGNSFWVKTRDFERSFYAGSPIESARFFPAELVTEAGGFEEGLVFFEESTLPYKIQRRGYDTSARIESVILHHEEDFLLVPWLKKKFGYGKTMQAYKHMYGSHSRAQADVWLRLGLFMKDWRRFLNGRKLAFGVIVLKGLEYFAAVSGSVIFML